MNIKLVILLSALAFTLTETPALACFCLVVKDFADVAEGAPVVVTGRVLSVGGSDARTPSVIRVKVDAVTKGEVGSEEVSAWDSMAETTCGGALRGVKEGMQLALALNPFGERPDTIKLWVRKLVAQMGREVSEDDWVLAGGGCGISIKPISG